MLGRYDCLPHSTARRWGKTVSCCLQPKPFTPGKDWKSQYEVMECILNGFWWLKTLTVCSSTPDPIPSLLRLRPIPLLRRCDLWSKASGQQRRTLKPRERGNALPNLSPCKHVSVPNKPGISGGFLPSNKRISGSILNGESVWPQPLYMGGNCSCFYLSGTAETNIGMNKCKDKSNSEG